MRWRDLSEAEQEKRLQSWEKLSEMFPAPNPWQRRGTDAGIALFDYATADNRLGVLAGWIGEVLAAVDQSGRWEETPERGLPESIERLDQGFRATAGVSGYQFRADFATFGEAWESVNVLAGLGMSLGYAVRWPTDTSTPDLELEPDRPIGEAYLKRLAREALFGSRSTDQSLTVIVSRESLVLECDCATAERAHLFRGVFEKLADDLLDILGWNPLPVR